MWESFRRLVADGFCLWLLAFRVKVVRTLPPFEELLRSRGKPCALGPVSIADQAVVSGY